MSAFHRQIGEFKDVQVVAGRRARRRRDLEPRSSTNGCRRRDDGDYIVSLMKPVSEPGQFATWIAPPRLGIDNKPGDFEYVKIAA